MYWLPLVALGARVTTDLLYEFEFTKAQCDAGTFVDKGRGLVGDLNVVGGAIS